MVTEIKLPSLGIAITEAVINRWLKSEGEYVERNEVIAEVVTDKVSFEINAPESGYLIKRFYNEGDTAKVDEVIAVIADKKDQDIDLPKASKPQKADTLQQEKIDQEQETQKEKSSKEVRAYPVARKIAEQHGIDLSQVKPSGKVISKTDVLNYLKQKRQQDKADEAEQPAGEEKIPFKGIRKRISENMLNSIRTAAHVTTMVEVDMTEASELRKKLNQSFETKFTFMPFFAKAIVNAIKKYPIFNSQLDKDFIIIKHYINLGIAVALEEGILVPVVKNAQNKDFFELADEINTFTENARNNKISLEDMAGATITISNSGRFGSVFATPIINQPQSCIIWTGKITKKPAVINDDQITIRSMMNLVMSYDHRVIDGSKAGQFLNHIKEDLEHPLKLVLSK